MMTMENKDKLRELLLKDGYPERDADYLLEDLLQLDSKLAALLEEWMADTSKTPDYAYEDISISSMMKDFKMTYIAALVSMDWIIKEPDKAIPAIKMGVQ